MLKSQEADLLKSLNFVQKARQLFQSHWGTPATGTAKTTTGKKRGRPVGWRKKTTPKVAAAPKKRGRKPGKKTVKATAVPKATTTPTTTRTRKATSTPKAKSGEKKTSHLSNIIGILNQAGKPMGSGEVINTLFMNQTADKNFKHYRLLIYPVLTKAYKSKALILKEGKIHLPS